MKIIIKVLVVISLFSIYSLYSNWTYNRSSALKCAQSTLDAIVAEARPKFYAYTGYHYSTLFENKVAVEQRTNSYHFTFSINTQFGLIEHRMEVFNNKLCPLFFGDFEISIDATKDSWFWFLSSLGPNSKDLA